MTETLEKEIFSFQTEVGQLLEIVAGSLYSNREVFLRELVSNASDACDKLRYAALTDVSLAPAGDFAISLEIDAKKKTLSISDNGIGMNHADLLATLGTIAKSGTSAFIEALKANDNDKPGLIGQFGVGFYSAFMVANNVDVLTRKADETAGWLWSSDGKGEFSIQSAERAVAGTTVTLHLKKDAKEFAEEARIRHIIKTYSEHISFPVKLGEETLNAAEALWTQPAKDITDEQYAEFYRQTSHAFDAPWHVLHNKVEGTLNHTSLLFVPSTQPLDLFEPERKSHIKLHVNRVFITETTTDLIPAYLRFMRGVVDSQDLSLNVSREMLQSDPKLAKIKTQISKKVLSELKKKANKTPEDYAQFWGNFGAVLKEGLVEDAALRHHGALVEHVRVAVVVSRLQRVRHGTLHDRAKAALRVRRELAERAEVGEYVLAEADDRGRLALNCGGVELAQRVLHHLRRLAAPALGAEAAVVHKVLQHADNVGGLAELHEDGALVHGLGALLGTELVQVQLLHHVLEGV